VTKEKKQTSSIRLFCFPEAVDQDVSFSTCMTTAHHVTKCFKCVAFPRSVSNKAPAVAEMMKFTLPLLCALLAAPIYPAKELRGSVGRFLSINCNNTAPHDSRDAGCPEDLPMCFLSDGGLPSANVSGDFCGKCLNVFPGNYKDLGCTDENPRCILTDGNDPWLGSGGMVCAPAVVPPGIPCTNDQSHGGKDMGCTSAYPICTNPDTKQEASSWDSGVCARCVNSFTAGFADYGCPSDSPRCSLDDGTEPGLLFLGTKCCPAEGCVKCPCTGISPGWDAFVNGKLNPPFKPGVTGSCNQNASDKEIVIIAQWNTGGLFVVGGVTTDQCNYGLCWDLSNKFALTRLTKAEGENCAAVLRTAMIDKYSIDVNAECPANAYAFDNSCL